jgi:hypothetical protein
MWFTVDTRTYRKNYLGILDKIYFGESLTLTLVSTHAIVLADSKSMVECTYGGDNTCQTSGTVYKVKCKANKNCKCYYVGKSQHFVKTRVQEHISELSKLYAKYILPTNQLQQTTHSTSSSRSTSTTQSRIVSFDTKKESSICIEPPLTFPPHCDFINSTIPTRPPGLRMQLRRHTHSNGSSISDRLAKLPPLQE